MKNKEMNLRRTEMKKLFLTIPMLIAASFIFTACEPAANTNTANKPANNANAAPAVNTAAIEADIKKLVNDVGAALVKNDADALDKMFADNFMQVNHDGSVQTKAERLASFRPGEMKYESVAYDEISVRTNPEGTSAVVIARSNAKITVKGQRINGYARLTLVWSKTKDGWRQVSSHVTVIAAAAPGTTAANTANANKAANTAKPSAPANK